MRCFSINYLIIQVAEIPAEGMDSEEADLDFVAPMRQDVRHRRYQEPLRGEVIEIVDQRILLNEVENDVAGNGRAFEAAVQLGAAALPVQPAPYLYYANVNHSKILLDTPLAARERRAIVLPPLPAQLNLNGRSNIPMSGLEETFANVRYIYIYIYIYIAIISLSQWSLILTSFAGRMDGCNPVYHSHESLRVPQPIDQRSRF